MMILIKKLFWWMFLAVALGGGVYWANKKGYFKNTPLAQVSWPEESIPKKLSEIPNKFKIPEKLPIKNINQDEIDSITQDATQQTQELATKVQEVSEHAQKVLGETVTDGEELPPLHERTLEYGKYVYCKEVVKEYENR